ncbi:MAG: hypothetical protein ACR2M3_09590 [Thermomicrobiales bacterium]
MRRCAGSSRRPQRVRQGREPTAPVIPALPQSPPCGIPLAGGAVKRTRAGMAVFIIYSIFLVLSVGIFQIYFQHRLAERARLALDPVAQLSRG